MLFIHSFPSLAVGLYKQASYFEERGYGVVVPDMLGYGGTDKPLDVSFYVQSGIARDLVDILDHEGLEDVIVFAHAWYVHTFPKWTLMLTLFQGNEGCECTCPATP